MIDKKLAAVFNAETYRHNTVRFTIERFEKDAAYKLNVNIEKPLNMRFAVVGDLAAPEHEEESLNMIKLLIDSKKEKINAASK